MGKKFYNCIPEVVLIMTGIQKVAELEPGVKVTKSNFFQKWTGKWASTYVGACRVRVASTYKMYVLIP